MLLSWYTWNLHAAISHNINYYSIVNTLQITTVDHVHNSCSLFKIFTRKIWKPHDISYYKYSLYATIYYVMQKGLINQSCNVIIGSIYSSCDKCMHNANKDAVLCFSFEVKTRWPLCLHKDVYNFELITSMQSDGSYSRRRKCPLFPTTWVHLRFLVGFMLVNS